MNAVSEVSEVVETAMKKVPSYWIPTRPFNVIAAVNRMALATGSVRYAMAGADADYNGHAVSVYFNSYRGYWLAEYTWSGRNVLARGKLEDCLRAGKREYDRGALGASVKAHYPDPKRGDDHDPEESPEEFERLCVEAGYTSTETVPEKEHFASWWTPLHEKVNDALFFERHGMFPAVGFLCNSKTVEEYEAKMDAHRNERLQQLAAERAQAALPKETRDVGVIEVQLSKHGRRWFARPTEACQEKLGAKYRQQGTSTTQKGAVLELISRLKGLGLTGKVKVLR